LAESVERLGPQATVQASVEGPDPEATEVVLEEASDGSDKKRTQSRGGTRQRIIEEAGLLFAERGYRGASIAEIEKRAGLAPGAGGLYRHFSSKEELLLEVVRAYKERLRLLRERQSPSGISVAEELWAVLRTLAEFLKGEQAMIRIGAETGSLPPRARQELAAAWNEGYGFLSDLFARHGCAPALADALAVSALGSLAHYFTQLGDSSLPPMGVPPLDYVVAWVDQWATLIEAGFGSNPVTSSCDPKKSPSSLEAMPLQFFQEGISFLDAMAASRRGRSS
jgi:AcrR family transcriptional regulator